jgi:DNA polymerase-1
MELLVDGDILLYRTTSSCEVEIDWGEDFWTLTSDIHEVRSALDHQLNKLKEDSNCDDVTICLTSKSNFRKQLNPSYKDNRSDVRKPLAFSEAKSYLKDHYNTQESYWLEADDLMGILSTQDPDNRCIVSEDKDLMTIPGWHWSFESKEMYTSHPDEANRYFFKQALTGDKTDGYAGCPGIGPVKADRLLDAADQEGVSRWKKVLDAYDKAGYDEAHALMQCRMAYILQKEQWNGLDKYPELWYPDDYE